MVYSSTSDELPFREGKWTQSIRCFEQLFLRTRKVCNREGGCVNPTGLQRDGSHLECSRNKEAGWTVKHLPGEWGILANEPRVTQTMSPGSRVSISHLSTERGSTKSLFPKEFCAGDRVRQGGFNMQSPMSHLRDAGLVGGGVCSRIS